MSDKRYVYDVEESTVDYRKYRIECDEELHDDVYNDIRELISQVDCRKEGDSAEYWTDNGIHCVVTYEYTDIGDDAQVKYSLYVDEHEGSYDAGIRSDV